MPQIHMYFNMYTVYLVSGLIKFIKPDTLQGTKEIFPTKVRITFYKYIPFIFAFSFHYYTEGNVVEWKNNN